MGSPNPQQELEIFRSVIASLNDGVIVWRSDGSVMLSNQAASDMLGFDVTETFLPEVVPEWVAVDADGNPLNFNDFPGPVALKTGQRVLRKVVGLSHLGGPIRWIEGDAYPLLDPDGKQTRGVMSIGRDITERMTAINALKENQRRTEIILAKSGNQFRILDWYGNVVAAVPPLVKQGIFESAEHIEVDGLPHVKYLGSSHAQVVEIFERVRGQYLASETHDLFIDSPVGGRYWIEVSLTNHLDDPAVGGIVLNYRDITARKESESQIRFQADLLARAGQAIIATDEHGHIVFWNQIAVEIYGWTADDAHDRHITDVIGSGDDNDVAEYGRATARCEQWSGDLTIHRRDGTLFAICVSSVPVFDANGGFIAVVGVSTDINERKASALALAEQASHDPLTGLVNRPMLMQEIETQLVTMQSSEIGFAVLFIGLDRFKVINEGTSHAVGDRILQLVSERLIATFPDEVVARFGSDEFVVLYRESSQSAVESMAGRVIDELQQPFKVDNHELVVGASMGISYAANNDTADSLLRDANAAMYEAKQGGRSQSRTYDNRSRKRAKERLNTEVGLRSAIDHGELFVEYQPMVSLLDNSIYGAEALVRWKHPLLGRISPDHFIPVAEETGLIIPIGRWVLDQALGQKVEWARHGVIPNATMNVNLSPRQLLDPTLVGSVEAAIDLSGIDPQKLTLEITENSLMHDIERSISVLERLSEMGVRLAVDDFGTGHSSMMYLQRLPIDVLKIDGSFVSGLGTNSGDSSIVRAISGLGEALDLAVVAEGVETETQLAALKGLHCNYGQGFLWSPALGGPELASWATATT
ncbi:MAG: diguanylate cyclase (GGDEF)-like protein/PAS domain S-box-containing protein [Ilumatobacter sp.]|jgi:diguanylate cyclase (GGDEF)-like protein/PAS domain S-box-containing protein